MVAFVSETDLVAKSEKLIAVNGTILGEHCYAEWNNFGFLHLHLDLTIKQAALNTVIAKLPDAVPTPKNRMEFVINQTGRVGNIWIAPNTRDVLATGAITNVRLVFDFFGLSNKE